MRSKSLIQIALLLLLTSCAGMNVTVEQDSRLSFKNYETFAFVDGHRPQFPMQFRSIRKTAKIGRMHDARLNEAMARAVEHELSGLGYTVAEVPAADFLVTYYIANEQHFSDSNSTVINVMQIDLVEELPKRLDYRNKGRRTKDVGLLIIEVVDAKDDRVVWRGAAESSTFFLDRAEVRGKLLSAAVREIFQKFANSGA